MPRRKSEVDRGIPADFSTPQKRVDGELYSRPEPNPFTDSWLDGYDAGFNREPISVGEYTKVDVLRYQDGYDIGRKERELIDSDHSSNA